MEWCVSALLLVLTVQTASSVPLIQAPWGTIQGVSVEGDSGRKMDAYLAIPYALSPVGDRRFEKPQPHPGPGEGQVFVADQVMPACPQVPALIGSARKTSEDCLMLNVFVPAHRGADSTTGPYAVMFFIHGGGFTLGDATSYRPSKLVVDGNVIVVVIQYRLGLLGFLSSGDDAVPANLGLRDQNLALGWVKDNIQAFGGDPDGITIFGESAGSMSVGFHLMMPQSKGLFKRAILQSGAPQHISGMTVAFDKKAAFKRFTDMFDCQGDSSRQLLQCLKQQPVDDLLEKSKVYDLTPPLLTYCLPFVDGDLLPGDLRELVQDQAFMQANGVGEVDVILGFNKDEGALILSSQFPIEVLLSSDYFEGTQDFCFALNGLPNNPVLKKSAEFFYRRSEAGSNMSQSLDPVVNLYGDCLFIASIIEWARYLAASPHSAARYLYVVDHDFAFNNQGPVPGAHHGDELALLFDEMKDLSEDSAFTIMNKTSITAEEQTLSETMAAMWTTFAKTGNPSPPVKDSPGGDWPEFTTEDEAYLSISGSPRVVTQAGPYRDRVALWLNHLPELKALTAQLPPEETPQEQATSKDEL